jgi:Ca2+-transporting ATPase
MAACVIAASLLSYMLLDLPPEQCNVIAFFSLAFSQLLHVVNNQITRNRCIWIALALCSAELFAAYLIPGTRSVLSFQNPGKAGWLLISRYLR